MIDLDNQTALCFDLDALEKIAFALTTQEVELLIVDNNTMLSINSEHRGKESATDVLSFPMETPFTEAFIFELPLGSIVISSTYVEEKAKLYNHTIQNELSLLFIHGMLHLLGYDHEVDDGEMRAREEEIINMFNLPKSLIVRTGE